MKFKFLLLLICFCNVVFSQNTYSYNPKNITIIRDKWGIPHVEGKTDADAVFGLIYAQCEDDFSRVERNYIEKLGRLSEITGEKNTYSDLLIRMLIKEKDAKAEYQKLNFYLKSLLDAHAEGVNYFLKKHPEIKPKLLTKFEPWYALLWTDGSIGAINTANITEADLKQFYEGGEKLGSIEKPEEYHQSGSNGFAIAPQKSTSGNAMLYINPHTSFYYRPEVHMKSKQGLNAYGAVTWGQFFIYQGFNEYCGWMHTSSNADVADTFTEKIKKETDGYYYLFDSKWRKIKTRIINLKVLENGKLITKTFTEYSTHHGPIMGIKDGKWISLRSYNRSQESLEQSWFRTKAKGLEDYKKIMDYKANTSNNTVFADKKGNIAYWHGNYMPIRNNKLDWGKDQDGSDVSNYNPKLHEAEDVIHVYNPKAGWIQNCNSTPFTAAGIDSPIKEKYPAYMAPDGENFRGLRAAKLLSESSKLDIDKLIALGYDKYLTAFEILIPGLKKYELENNDTELKEALDSLLAWNYVADKNSIATTLAIEWAQKLNPAIRKIYVDQGELDQVQSTKRFIENANQEDLLKPLKETLEDLKKTHGTWKIKWGEINRFQRINNNIPEIHNDSLGSVSVSMASALWGSLPSFNSKKSENTKLRYGFSGNSFVCAVEFGSRIKAKSLLAGGNNGNVNSAYFNNQANDYAEGRFKEVLFYKEDILKNKIKIYKP